MQLDSQSSTRIVEPASAFTASKLQGPKNEVPVVQKPVAEKSASPLGKGDSIAPPTISPERRQQLVYAHMNSRGSAEAIQRANGVKPKFVGTTYESFWKSYDERERKNKSS